MKLKTSVTARGRVPSFQIFIKKRHLRLSHLHDNFSHLSKDEFLGSVKRYSWTDLNKLIYRYENMLMASMKL